MSTTKCSAQGSEGRKSGVRGRVINRRARFTMCHRPACLSLSLSPSPWTGAYKEARDARHRWHRCNLSTWIAQGLH